MFEWKVKFNVNCDSYVCQFDDVQKFCVNEALINLRSFLTLIVSTWRNDAFWLSTIVILITLLSCIVSHHMDLRQRMVGAQMRIACSAAIYRKTLRMSKLATTQTSAGNVVNLLSNDVSRLDYGFIFVHYIWILPIQGELSSLQIEFVFWFSFIFPSESNFDPSTLSLVACLICYLIWREVKYAAVVGVIGLLLKTVPIQTGLSRVSSILRYNWKWNWSIIYVCRPFHYFVQPKPFSREWCGIFCSLACKI